MPVTGVGILDILAAVNGCVDQKPDPDVKYGHHGCLAAVEGQRDGCIWWVKLPV